MMKLIKAHNDHNFAKRKAEHSYLQCVRVVGNKLLLSLTLSSATVDFKQQKGNKNKKKEKNS